jgi:16S rRNA (guanine(966)-N(2))-methyltransferase RsmD
MGRVLGALFNILESSGGLKGARFLDLFSGTGSVAMEALRRGASSVTAVEYERARAAEISARFAALRDENMAECLRADVRRALPRLLRDASVFDVIFADPPYGLGWSESLPGMIASHSPILAPGGVFILERSLRDTVAGSPSESAIFHPREDRVYGGTILSIYRKKQEE